MRANVQCGSIALRCLTAFLDDKKLTHCIEGDEEAGYVWVDYQDATGRVVPAIIAEPGALIYDDVQVIKLKGVVRFEIDPPEGMTADDVRCVCGENFAPIQPARLEPTA